MAEEEKEKVEADSGADEQQGKKGKKAFLKWGIIGSGALVVAIVLGLVAWRIILPRILQTAGSPQEQVDPGPVAVAKSNPTYTGCIYALDDFLVNLYDPSGDRFLKIKMELEIDNEAVSEEIKVKLPQVRDSVLLLLSSKSSKEVSTVEGKLSLKNEILHRINPMLGAGKIRTIYFTDFIIQ
jgi:flagellar FliL protein